MIFFPDLCQFGSFENQRVWIKIWYFFYGIFFSSVDSAGHSRKAGQFPENYIINMVRLYNLWCSSY